MRRTRMPRGPCRARVGRGKRARHCSRRAAHPCRTRPHSSRPHPSRPWPSLPCPTRPRPSRPHASRRCPRQARPGVGCCAERRGAELRCGGRRVPVPADDPSRCPGPAPPRLVPRPRVRPWPGGRCRGDAAWPGPDRAGPGRMVGPRSTRSGRAWRTSWPWPAWAWSSCWRCSHEGGRPSGGPECPGRGAGLRARRGDRGREERSCGRRPIEHERRVYERSFVRNRCVRIRPGLMPGEGRLA